MLLPRFCYTFRCYCTSAIQPGSKNGRVKPLTWQWGQNCVYYQRKVYIGMCIDLRGQKVVL